MSTLNNHDFSEKTASVVGVDSVDSVKRKTGESVIIANECYLCYSVTGDDHTMPYTIEAVKGGFKLTILAAQPGQQNYSVIIHTAKELIIAEQHLIGERHKTKECPLCQSKREGKTK